MIDTVASTIEQLQNEVIDNNSESITDKIVKEEPEVHGIKRSDSLQC